LGKAEHADDLLAEAAVQPNIAVSREP